MKVKKRITRFLKSCYFDRNCEKETIVLVSSARSGSTWIQTIISSADSFRVLFEPFHPEKVAQFSDWPKFVYVGRSETKNPQLELVRSLFRGEISNEWIDQDNSPWTFFPRKRLIKAIRANLFVAWLKRNFPSIRVIFLIRHPFSVAKSQLQCGWQDSPRLFLQQRNLVAQHFSQDEQTFLSSLSTSFGNQVGAWAIENLIPLRELNTQEALAISYEDMVASPEQEVDRIARFLGRRYRIQQRAILQKSRTTGYSKRKRIVFSSEEIREGSEVLKRFGLDRIYDGHEPKPPKLANRDLFSEFRIGEQGAHFIPQ